MTGYYIALVTLPLWAAAMAYVVAVGLRYIAFNTGTTLKWFLRCSPVRNAASDGATALIATLTTTTATTTHANRPSKMADLSTNDE